ncbi:MAG TPA: class I SAM-dependent methyltransferase [Saccharofermentans sp.]|nr:class I SAM-dependent methyltransferase [Saccharofermentans sp.]
MPVFYPITAIMDNAQNINAKIDKEFYKTESLTVEDIENHPDKWQLLHWKSIVSAVVRYDQMAKYCKNFESFSIFEIGCGFGGFCEIHKDGFSKYVGIDNNPAFIRYANKTYGNVNDIAFFLDDALDFSIFQETYGNFDCTIVSGLFNNRGFPAWHPKFLTTFFNEMIKMSNMVFCNFPSAWCLKREPTFEYFSPSLVLDSALSVTPNVVIEHNMMADCLVVLSNSKLI